MSTPEPVQAVDQKEVAVEVDAQKPNSPAKKADQKVAPAKTYRGKEDRPDYHVVCCENSCRDLFAIPLFTICLWGFMTGLSILVVYATYQSSTTQAALWVYFFAWLAGVVYLGVTIATTDLESSLKIALNKKLALDDVQEAA